MVLDSGSLKLPDGRTFTGDFTICHKEKWNYTYYEIVPGANIPFTKEPMLFFGSISNSSSMGYGDKANAPDSSVTPMINHGE
jgi:hypothetical protein